LQPLLELAKEHMKKQVYGCPLICIIRTGSMDSARHMRAT